MTSQPCSQIDEEIFVVAQQLQEIQAYLDSQKGKRRADGSPKDGQDIIREQYEELRTYLRSLEDKKLATSIALAVDSDSRVIAALTREEAQASDDRRLAIRMSVRDDDPDSLTMESEVEQPNAVGEPQSSDDECVAGPSMTYRERQALELEKSAATETQCCVCYESFYTHKVTRLDCNHKYCNDCLKDLFRRATKDSTLFPPRCCRMPIHLEIVQKHMSETEISDFRSAEIEFATTDRTYCCNASCGKFILPHNITAGRAQCPHCRSDTCAMCKNSFHTDDCVEDADLQATLALASTQRWQRCFRCRALVDLGIGCANVEPSFATSAAFSGRLVNASYGPRKDSSPERWKSWTVRLKRPCHLRSVNNGLDRCRKICDIITSVNIPEDSAVLKVQGGGYSNVSSVEPATGIIFLSAAIAISNFVRVADAIAFKAA
ncbi:hypothetical protein CBS147343_3065 [Aspergillus niger]|uniref:Caspase domain family protein n=1 Tax=Aspergillus niger TaxID=5061 RepID=A0A3F3RTH1_ASPNG|nr:hypothetical protein CBS147323_5753 [Aspergillus niger]KAI3010215.1 hypothetical protein CBS147345_6543 [Aspergillus niger]KAI3030793.1 hypothetical protein CBS147347_2466 [Aspergillus niger]KAI3082122.1 hypothetical protein CBS147343_3065 [Aspergillus niger]TPR04635.1 Caspase domain family protein [Aspergillus niger]